METIISDMDDGMGDHFDDIAKETIKFSLDGIDCEYVFDVVRGADYAELYSSCYFKNGKVYEPSKEELKRLGHHAFNLFYYPEQHEKN